MRNDKFKILDHRDDSFSCKAMVIDRFQIRISDAIGSVSAETVIPTEMKAVFTFAHGAGAGMDHPFMKKLAMALADTQIGTMRFNFPFLEGKKKRVDSPAVAHAAIGRALEHITSSDPAVPLFASGKSFGGRMTSQLASKQTLEGLRGIVFFGFPLHPAKKPSIDRAEHLSSVRQPMLFLQGTNDDLAELPLMTQVVEKLPNARLEIIEGADHSFKAGRQDMILLLSQKTSAWCDFFL